MCVGDDEQATGRVGRARCLSNGLDEQGNAAVLVEREQARGRRLPLDGEGSVFARVEVRTVPAATTASTFAFNAANSGPSM